MNLSDSWSSASTVRGFATGAPNQTLVTFAREELARRTRGRALDIGCGAGRNAVPLARLGWEVVGLDLSMPMVVAASKRVRDEAPDAQLHLALATMDRLPVAEHSCDFLVAHGIWNLARSGEEFRAGVREAARVARPGASLFVFTFSRNTLDADVQPVADESFIYTQFAGEPQVFLTEAQLVDELGAAGFAPDPLVPLRELNRRTPGMLSAVGAPVIWQGAFRGKR